MGELKCCIRLDTVVALIYMGGCGNVRGFLWQWVNGWGFFLVCASIIDLLIEYHKSDVRCYW